MTPPRSQLDFQSISHSRWRGASILYTPSSPVIYTIFATTTAARTTKKANPFGLAFKISDILIMFYIIIKSIRIVFYISKIAI